LFHATSVPAAGRSILADVSNGILGIDIGGSGIKGNLVDTTSGDLLAERYKVATPQPSKPKAVAEAVAEMVEHFGYQGLLGATFPAIVKNGVALSAANVHDSWIGTDASRLFSEATGLETTVVNDADAAAVAEMAFGAGRDVAGVVLVLTFGTGIGSGMFVDGRLVPNTELGHLHFAGYESVEDWASARAKEDQDVSYDGWSDRVRQYLDHLTRIFSPELFIIGGGISRKWQKYGDRLTVGVPVVKAELQNEAGIVGAALAAIDQRIH
jgi:polyphosphate glucokinase